MQAPDLRTCTEEELWKYVGYHLSEAGVDSVLVGGAVVAIYSKGAYHSGDLDFVAGKGMYAKVKVVLERLGFESVRGRHFEHPNCPHLIVEFPPGPLSIGDDNKIKPAEISVDGRSIKILSPTDCIRDRMASYIHFNARECLDQAVLVAKNQPFDLARVKSWCLAEGAATTFEEFRKRVESAKS
jgi:hypothetical protein